MLFTNVSFLFLLTEGPGHHRYTAEHDKCKHDEHYRLPGQDLWTFWQNKVISVLLEEYSRSCWCTCDREEFPVWSTFLLVVTPNWFCCCFAACEWQDQTKGLKMTWALCCRTKNLHVLSKSPLKIPPSSHAKHLGLSDSDKELILSLASFQRYGGISVGGVNSQVRLTEEEVQSAFDDLRKLFAAFPVRNYK